MNKLVIAASLATALTACGSQQNRNSLTPLNYEGELKEDFEAISVETNSIPTLFAQFLQAKKNAIQHNGPQDSAPRSISNREKHIPTYVSYGVALSDLYCQDLFSRQFNFEKQVNHLQRNIRLAGDIALAGMGLHGSTAPSALAGWALGFSGIDRYQENFKQTYFLSESAVFTVEEKLEAARKINAVSLNNYAKNINVEVATSLIAQYHDSCSIKNIQNFIAKSVELSKYNPNSVAPNAESFNFIVDKSLTGQETRRLSKKVNGALGFNSKIPLRLDYLRAIYSQVLKPTSSIAIAEKANTASTYKAYIDAYKNNVATTPSKNSALVDILTELNAYIDLETAHDNVETKFVETDNSTGGLAASNPIKQAAEKQLGKVLSTPIKRLDISPDMGITITPKYQE